MEDMETFNIVNSPFTFSAQAPETLSSPKQTLATIVRDCSGSTSRFADELTKAMNEALGGCRKSSYAGNILVRTLTFADQVEEIHGFTELGKIPDYKDIQGCGNTALFDATYSAISATVTYADKLRAMDYSVNAVVFIITDGDDNRSVFNANTVGDYIKETIQKEHLGSVVTVLIGVNDQEPSLAAYLKDFKETAGLDQYISMGEVTPGKLAKLADFVSKSVSSSSQSLAQGSGQAQASQLTF